MKTLIPLSDFVLEQSRTQTLDRSQIDWYDAEMAKLELIRNYAEFLKQPLTLSMFTGENKLFEGFTYERIPIMGNILKLKGEFICMADDLKNSKATIEDLIKDNSIYQLTPYALQQIQIEN
ncbi:hypothetical protein U9K52_09810 [Chryseobacterium sp. MHB01]|uniref:hypothetical protein n=1 Tax=Chryseobacterium sp. MHB01 TaxID=3109433 RepID=UPI002AFE1B22|nr:hypothetical protein [Chryseobacterium sp. MHB01]MEA1849207.1 hypothetical protein [Chryseobacterium sp. MHB01]